MKKTIPKHDMNPLTAAPLVVVAKGQQWREDAARLAQSLGLPLQDHVPDFAIGIQVGDGYLALQEGGKRPIGPVHVELVGGHLARQRRESGFRKQPFFRALGLSKPQERMLHVVDATAGLGRDTARMLYAGCQVTAIERHPVVAALLEDGIARACNDFEWGLAFRERLRFFCGDAAEILPRVAASSQSIDVVYLDPMFPERKKKAQVKREMQLLQRLHGVGEELPTHDEQSLLAIARELASNRVVVKRPPQAPHLGVGVHHSIQGDTVRFDVYIRV